MKIHTQQFKNELSNMGRQLKGIITYNNTAYEEEIFAITPHFEANILKSVMKQLDLETSLNIPVGAEINCQIGLLVSGDYEMLDYGNYIVYSIEKQEDKDNYKIVAYDKMLYSMKEYEELEIQYPTSVKNYLSVLANAIGLDLKDTNFYNYNQQIPGDLYKDLGYTYRDVLDDIAQATGSIIVINEDDELEVKYPSQTGDTINEEFLKDINVNFGEQYGRINAIVLSRAGESDNVYIRDDESVEEYGLCEVKIVDNQIMNGNNRSDYLPGLLSALDGLYYFINNFSSIGIMYYDVGDIYTIQIGENNYQCLMLNDEINVTQGIEENIHTDMPEQSETDYTKADKTDQRINQTYIIVDKQNQTIESVVSNVTEQNEQIARVTQTVDELNSKISDIADITTSQESVYANVSFTDINQSEPIRVEIKPIGTSISYLYPRDNLYPANDLYMPDRILRFTNTSTSEVFDYELPTDLLYYDSDNYDEFILDYDSQTCIVNKKVGYNADGSVYVLSNPTTLSFTYPSIELTDGDYTITIPGYNTAYLFVRLMAQNIYTTQFATRAEVNSQISQTAQEIDLSVDSKLTNYSTTTQMNTAITLSQSNILSSVSTTYATKTELGNTETSLQSEIEQTAGEIRLEVGGKLDEADFTSANIILALNNDSSSATIKADKISLDGKQINLTADNTTITSTNFAVDKNGNVQCQNINIGGGKIDLTGGTESNPNFRVKDSSEQTLILPWGIMLSHYNTQMAWLTCNQNGAFLDLAHNGMITLYKSGGSVGTEITEDYVKTPQVIQTSLESEKKNFEKLNDALSIIKATDIYKYNLKTQTDNAKKHIGFVIGDNYNYSKEITSQANDGVDVYSMVAVAYKAIQEQQEFIEKLEARIQELEKGER